MFKAIGDQYSHLPDEAVVINALAAALAAAAIVLPVVVQCGAFKKGLPSEGAKRSGV